MSRRTTSSTATARRGLGSTHVESETDTKSAAAVSVGKSAQNDLSPALTPHAAQVLLRIIVKHKTRLDAA